MFVSQNNCHPRVTSRSLPHLTLTISTSSLSPFLSTSPIFPTVSPTHTRSTVLVRCYTAEWRFNTNPISHTLGASEAQGIESMMRDLGFAEKPVLVIDAKATHSPSAWNRQDETHRRGAFVVRKMTSSQTGWKSAASRARTILADIGTKTLSNKIIRMHATSMGTLMLKRT